MKRSLAILRIAECLIEPHYPDDPLREAGFILGRLEKLGMHPPAMPKQECPECNNGFGILEWEVEDEA